MIAYHFVGDTLRDGRPVPPDGEWLRHIGPIHMCKAGLHASKDPFDALQYAPGEILCLVELDGEIIEDTDKVVARRRKIIKRIDATDLLRKFSRDQWAAASAAARDAASAAARDAARDAAWDARRAAAIAAARTAVSDAEMAAAWYAAWDAAWDAARAAFNVAVKEALQ